MTAHVIYRIQDKKGRGPYRSGLSDALTNGDPIDYERAPNVTRPGPSSDGLGYPDDHDYYGFSSMDQLRRWFRTNRHEIPRQRSKIRIVYAMRVQYGGHQVTYDKRSVIHHD